MLAQMLTKAVQANVAAEAHQATRPSKKESTVTDPAIDPTAPATDPTAPAPAQEGTPSAATAADQPAPEQAPPTSDQAATPDATAETSAATSLPPVSPDAVIDDVKEKLEHAAKLAQALQDNPEVLRFMNALFATKA